MKAAVLHGKEDVRIEQVPEAALRAGEVRLRIEAALTCGTDLKVYKRGYHARMIRPPAVFGHEMAGVIVEVHPQTRGWQTGERVVVANSAPCERCFYCGQGQENLCEDLLFLNGAYAESIVVPARLVEKNMWRLKPETAFADAALAEPLACVVQGMQDVHPHPGERVLILGAGPIGLMFAALLHSMKADVIVAGRGRSRLEVAHRLGARQVVDVTEQPDTVAAVRATGEPRFDVVIEAVGKPQTWQAALELVRKGGRVNLFGGCPSGTTVTLDTSRVHYSNLYLVSSFHHTPRTVRRALNFIEAGVIRARDFVDGECSLDELPALFRSMAAGNKAVKTLVHPRG